MFYSGEYTSQKSFWKQGIIHKPLKIRGYFYRNAAGRVPNFS